MSKLKWLLCCFAAGVLLTACGNSAGNVGQHSKGDGEVVEKKHYVQNNNLHHIGETIDIADPLPENEKNVSMQYTVNSAKLYSAPSEAGISEEQIKRAEYYSSPINVELMSVEEVMNSPMIVVDISIKNVNEEDPNITIFTLVNKNGDGEITPVAYPCYYSEAKTMDESKYFHYTLLPGQNITMQIGWYINPADYNLKDIYLTDHLYSSDDLSGYVELGLTEDGKVE